MWVSRIAPTPSGFLHVGNAFNFLLTSAWVRRNGGRLRLRVDDLDTTRTRPEYLEDLFETLSWLGLEWEDGPKDVQDLIAHHSQALRRSRYLEVLQDFLNLGLAYVCECSRGDLEKRPCPCPGNERAFDPARSRVRIDLYLPDSVRKTVTLWRHEGIPAYQLVSLVDDLDHGVNLVVRGEDLIESTEIQRAMARSLGALHGADRFESIRFLHHPLVLGPDGAKLSKSRGADALKVLFPRTESSAALHRLLEPEISRFLDSPR
jgi:glutamyl/glutaminyl-tRNA synthetase